MKQLWALLVWCFAVTAAPVLARIVPSPAWLSDALWVGALPLVVLGVLVAEPPELWSLRSYLDQLRRRVAQLQSQSPSRSKDQS